MKLLLWLTISGILIPFILAGHSKKEWASRSIYQVLTDRFARTDGDTKQCADFHKYCGGSWKGITKNLEYIKGMGFDAIWISPVVDNTPDGYHGYWARNWEEVNSNFGDRESLKELIQEAHKLGIWVMVDVIANHVGPVHLNYTTIKPFNDASHYHDYCMINDPDWEADQWRVENCRLADLPDLKQENPFVRNYLLNWIKNLVTEFDIDGLRVDTTPEVPKDFWAEYAKAANVFTLGEVFSNRKNYIRPYIGPLDSVLNYPMFFSLRNSFRGSSFWDIWDTYNQMEEIFSDELDYMAVFVDNHDNVRLRHFVNEYMTKSALAFSLITRGIPIFYYGGEQNFHGETDPYNREPLWTNMDPNSANYQFVKILNRFRKEKKLWTTDYKQLAFDDHFYAIKRGQTVAVFTNNEWPMGKDIEKVPFPDGTKLCNYLVRDDCVIVNYGKMHIEMKQNEMVKLYTFN